MPSTAPSAGEIVGNKTSNSLLSWRGRQRVNKYMVPGIDKRFEGNKRVCQWSDCAWCVCVCV